MADEPKTPCRTPSEGKSGATNIPCWKFDTIHAAILDILQTGPCPWQDLTEKVRSRLAEDHLARMGSLGWHVVSVKLEMEVRGDITRSEGRGPQILEIN